MIGGMHAGHVVENVARVVGAFLLALPRGFALVGRALPGMSAEGLARVLQGVAGGVGFIGGGAILKEG